MVKPNAFFYSIAKRIQLLAYRYLIGKRMEELERRLNETDERQVRRRLTSPTCCVEPILQSYCTL